MIVVASLPGKLVKHSLRNSKRVLAVPEMAADSTAYPFLKGPMNWIKRSR
jgi:hypothetical protein